jgi:protein gp37
VPNLADHEFFISQNILGEPKARKKPSTIFVGDMFDLFHEAIPDDFILDVWDIMNQSRQHTFQVLTKRAARMQNFISRLHAALGNEDWYFMLKDEALPGDGYRLPNVWIGVSVEDQQRADERIPLLLQTPAAVRFLSVEPQLEEVDLLKAFYVGGEGGYEHVGSLRQMIHQVICGGESGPSARPFQLEWAVLLLAECRNAGVPFFMKQLGSRPRRGDVRLKLKDSKGGDPTEWPKVLRVREFPR